MGGIIVFQKNILYSKNLVMGKYKNWFYLTIVIKKEIHLFKKFTYKK